MKVDAMTYETVLVEKDANKVATVTINRPEQLNSFNVAMCEEFQHLWLSLRDDESVNAIVLRAAPGRAFSTGYDVKNGGKISMADNIWAKVDPGEYLGPKSNKLWKPVVTAVHGMCAGGAFYWVNESDIVICSDDATFFDPHVTYGMVAALEPIGLLQRIPLAEVLRIALTGNDERMGAETALRVSLVTEVTTGDKLWDRAYALALAMATKPPAAIQGTVRAIWEALDQTRSAALQTGMSYVLLGNPIGMAQVDRASLMSGRQPYVVR